MKKMNRGFFVILLALELLPLPLFAIEALKISVVCPDVVLSWPSTNAETYIVQYRPTLNTNDPWVTLTNSLPAALNTNWTTFVHASVTECPQAGEGGGGSGGGGGVPSPNGSQSASSQTDQPIMTPEERA